MIERKTPFPNRFYNICPPAQIVLKAYQINLNSYFINFKYELINSWLFNTYRKQTVN